MSLISERQPKKVNRCVTIFVNYKNLRKYFKLIQFKEQEGCKRYMNRNIVYEGNYSRISNTFPFFPPCRRASRDDAGEYECRAHNMVGTRVSEPARLRVTGEKKSIVDSHVEQQFVLRCKLAFWPRYSGRKREREREREKRLYSHSCGKRTSGSIK